MTTIALRTICLDCSDAHAMADFYGGLLGWERTYTEPDWVLMRDPGEGAGLSFQAEEDYVPPVWPERRGDQQKMIHLDIRVTPSVTSGSDASGSDASDSGPTEEERQAALAEAVERAVSLGGRVAPRQERDDLRVILDPAGHPLCLFLD